MLQIQNKQSVQKHAKEDTPDKTRPFRKHWASLSTHHTHFIVEGQ